MIKKIPFPLVKSPAMIFLVLMTCTVMAFGQQGARWPAITKETKAWSRWWWLGSAVNNRNLTILMEKYKAAGLGGLEITPIYGIRGAESQFIPYLSPQWMQVLDHTLKEGTRLDLGIDMANATGWPFGGPWVTEKDAAKNVQVKTYDLKAGETLQEVIRYQQEPFVRTNGKSVNISQLVEPVTANKNLQDLALDQVRFSKQLPLVALLAYSKSGKVMDLTGKVDASGKLNWVAPAESWTLYALFQGLHGKMVERAAPGGEGLVIDHFSAKALSNYLNRFDEAFKGHDIHALRAFFNDSYEVDDASGQSNWTPDMFALFKNRRGYDLKAQLPALFGKDTPEKNSRVICDYRETISDLLLENFTKPWHDWGHGKGALIRNQSHGSPANILDLYAAIDIPETEGTDVLRFKFATSAAHVTGKKLASSESATWLDDHFLSSLGNVKPALDLLFTGGVNHIFYHGISYSPREAKWPGWLFYAAVHFSPENPEWRHFSALNDYVARCQSFLQSGQPDNDILFYYPLMDRFSDPGNALLRHFDGMEREFTGTVFKASAEKLLERGYAFDFISDRQVLNLKTGNQEILTGGNTYKTILIADVRLMPLETFGKLVQLAKEGASVLVYKNLPEDVPGFGQLEARRTTFKNLLAQLHFTKTGNAAVQKAVIGKGSFYMGSDLDALLTTGSIRRETMTEKGLLFERRKTATGNCYFMVNNGNQPINGFVPLSVKAASVALFNPMTGGNGMAEIKPEGGSTEVYVQLLPKESCILQTFHTAVKGAEYAYVKPAGDAMEIKGPWKLGFEEGGPALPKDTALTHTGLWTALEGDAFQQFSGTGTYTTTFAAPGQKGNDWLLDLGKVHESATVYLNGHKLATLIGPVYQAKVPQNLLKATNTLEIKVANLMANRIIAMEKNHEEYRIFYNTNFPAHSRANADNKGLFTASRWKPLPSGLLGPVTLTPVENQKFR